MTTIRVLSLGLATPPLILAYFGLLLTAITFSACSAVFVALLARDYRSSNNLNGAFMGPAILATMACVMLLPPGAGRLILLGALFLVVGLALLGAALKLIGLERLAQ